MRKRIDRSGEVRERLARARRVVALTGPGLSVAGGVPAFSPSGHLLAGRRAAEVAAPDPFFEDPIAIWRWYDELRAQLAPVRPNAAHRALADLERRARTFTLVTGNIDGLHQLAGTRAVLELHGNIWVVRCTRCGLRALNREIPIPSPPSCAFCTGLVRPDILWQGEHLPEELLVRCFQALSKCEVLLVAGICGRRQPASSFIDVARKAGAYVVEIPGESSTEGSPDDVLLTGPIEEILPQIVLQDA